MTSAETSDGAIYPIRAVERVCDILDILHDQEQGVALADVAREAKLPKSSAYRYLLALEGRRYVQRDAESGLFRLGLAFRPQRSRQMELFIERAQSQLERLRDDLNETVNIGVLDGGQIVHVAVVECTQMMRLAARIGERSPLHATALGKVIAAQLEPERVAAILAAEGMPPLTNRTLTTPEDFLAEVKKVKTTHYAIDDLEAQDDGRCVAVPLLGLPVAAGLSVSAPANRLPRNLVPDVVRALRASATSLTDGYRRLPT
ncbi:IclR family transcriptional regulator [Jatrophihabitans cynanchi]|jgi:IclR family acetate operon transcriptional repressor|uniref:IclR family transcriptional regulator n=1 Tax=Jatrophihabitans cynanchi TaxID=2944128 RepID=A0ABY7K0B9_9ACTN|nr:IclR family transcriptional regulator [Jatrophihabitans sp. SB3-54]WAX58301.1 IclR family transcriptional regulator [Jatrophihabitans sp. SB3-54]